MKLNDQHYQRRDRTKAQFLEAQRRADEKLAGLEREQRRDRSRIDLGNGGAWNRAKDGAE